MSFVGTGRVLPEKIGLTTEPYSVRWTGFEDFGELRQDIFIERCQVVVKGVMAAPHLDHWTLKNIVEQDVRKMVDLAGYTLGISLDVTIDTVTMGGEMPFVFGPEIPILFARRQENPLVLSREQQSMLLTAPGFAEALADYREAMRTPLQTGFFCYRAVETLMQTFKGAVDDRDRPAWEALRAALNVDRAGIDVVKQHADWARHGRARGLTDGERAALFTFTEIVLDRYMAFVLDGRRPLERERYPIQGPIAAEAAPGR